MNITKLIFYSIVACCITYIQSDGLVYIPLDITHLCALSNTLKYELSYGSGTTDTITLVLRNHKELEYQCTIKFVTQPDVFLIIVIMFPSGIPGQCVEISNTFMVVINEYECVYLCSLIKGMPNDNKYFMGTVLGHFSLKFSSNFTVKDEFMGQAYQITATASRRLTRGQTCNNNKTDTTYNETECAIDDTRYCFTRSVNCDGIRNCGVDDWYDERSEFCKPRSSYPLGWAPVFAVVAVMLFLLLGGIHLLSRCLPPVVSSYFIFNANEDNRFCIDPLISSKSEDDRPQDMIPFRLPSYGPQLSPSSSSSTEMASDDPHVFTKTTQQPAAHASRRVSLMLKMKALITDRLLSISRVNRKSIDFSSSEDQTDNA